MTASRSATTKLDRTVYVTVGPAEIEGRRLTFSDLTSIPYLVLLGEPGSGKSTVLDTAAAAAGREVITARALRVSGVQVADPPLFVDALDEDRSDGSKKDKIIELCDRLLAVSQDGWRISCRVEDWRGAADLSALQLATKDRSVVVAQLQSLTPQEQAAILAGRGLQEPDVFIEKARRQGAASFLENPLSLTLLHRAVESAGQWPANRYRLFDAATAQLSREHNTDRLDDEGQTPSSQVLEAASDTCLALLVTGHEAVWRDRDSPGEVSLPLSDLWAGEAVLRGMLDTALFHSEGSAFRPAHRTIAEYLGARSIAERVAGRRGETRLLPSRARAIICGNELRPPTELRGLYAWYAAHLAELGHSEESKQLAEADPWSVLAFGDAAVLSTEACTAIVNTLGQDDPWYMASDRWYGDTTTSLAGLARADMVEIFLNFLARPDRQGHVITTVFDAIETGPVLPDIRPRLREIVLDDAWAHYDRMNSLHAWLNGSVVEEQSALFDSAKSLPATNTQVCIRIKLIERLGLQRFQIGDIRSILTDYERYRDAHRVGDLYLLSKQFSKVPLPGLFDVPVTDWRDTEGVDIEAHEVDQALDDALILAIGACGDADVPLVWTICNNRRQSDFDSLSEQARTALVEWINRNPGHRTVSLFKECLSRVQVDEGARVPVQRYWMLLGTPPSGAVVQHLINEWEHRDVSENSDVLLCTAIEVARELREPHDSYWLLYNILEAAEATDELIAHLTKNDLDDHRIKRMKRSAEKRASDDRVKDESISKLLPITDGIRVAEDLHVLGRAARTYFHRGDGEAGRNGLSAIEEISNPEITEAIVEGWKLLAQAGDRIELSALTKRRWSASEDNSWYAVLAGVSELMSQGDETGLDSLPMETALLIVARSWMLSNNETAARLVKWAVPHLGRFGNSPVDALLFMWNRCLEDGAEDSVTPHLWDFLDCPDEIAVRAVRTLLMDRPSLPSQILTEFLSVAMKLLDSEQMMTIVQIALSDETLSDEQTSLWHYAAFCMAPSQFTLCLRGETEANSIAHLFDQHRGHRILEAAKAAFPGQETGRSLAFVELLPASLPGTPTPHREGWVSPEWRAEDAVHAALKYLSSTITEEAIAGLRRLCEMEMAEGWRPHLLHARAQQMKLKRDADFRHPTLEQLKGALSDGPPANAADMRSIVVEVLDQLGRYIRHGDTSPWKRFWNVDQYQKPKTARPEEQCRDALLDLLRERLKPYGMTLALPEAQQANATRVDILFSGGGLGRLPLEAKRHWNPEIWSAPEEQLAGYAQSPGADGFGIYVVFWFGSGFKPVPGMRSRGGGQPESVDQLRQLLDDELPGHLQDRISIIVVDVADS